MDRKLKKSATAVLISNCHVLTNRHAVGGVHAGPEGDAEEDLAIDVVGNVMEFEIGFDAFNTSRLRSMSTATVIAAGSGGALGDWAVLRLRRSLGKRYGVAHFEAPQLSQSVPVTTAGFPAAKLYEPDDHARLAPSRWLWQQRGILKGDQEHWTAELSVLEGQSGSPVFIRRDNRYAVVGLLRAEFSVAEAKTQATHACAQVVPISRFLIERINAIIESDPCD